MRLFDNSALAQRERQHSNGREGAGVVTGDKGAVRQDLVDRRAEAGRDVADDGGRRLESSAKLGRSAVVSGAARRRCSAVGCAWR